MTGAPATGRPTPAALTQLLVDVDPGGVVAASLVGSAAVDGLRPDSDLDLLVLTRRPLDHGERLELVDRLLRVSGRRAADGAGRPVELLSLCLEDVVPWRWPAVRDFGYGEWLREDYLTGRVPGREVDPNLPVVVTSARDHAVALLGPPPSALLEPVAPEHLQSCLLDALPSLLGGLVGDERNVLLTLARMVVTRRTRRIVPKDVAAVEVAPLLPPGARRLVLEAARAYREGGEMVGAVGEAAVAARLLAERVECDSSR